MNLFELAAVLTLDRSGYDRGLDDAESKASSFGSKLKGGLATAAKVGAAAIGAATTAATAFAKSSVDVGMSFDSSMSQVAATMGTTVDEIQDLRDFAQEMGSKTAFSASQAADALNYMALAGYDAETSMSMLPNVLNLAAAGGIDLAYASDMVTDASSALGLSLDETSELVDKMAKASSKSNTSVAQLGEAILTVGGTAKNLAGGTTELSTALGILADNGVKGAEGGTALRNIILSLSAPTKDTKAYMEQLGLEVYDANGNMRSLNEIFIDLNGIMSDMTQGEKTKVLNNLFNKVDLKSANALLANTIGSFENIESAIKDTGVQWEKYDVSAETALQNAAYMLEGLGLSAEEAQKQLSLEMNIDAADALATINVARKALDEGAFTTMTRFDELSGYIDGAWYSVESLDKALQETSSVSLSEIQKNLEKLGVTSKEFTAALNASGGVAEIFAEEIWAAADATATDKELSDALSPSLEELQQAFDKTTGAAQTMADTQLDNLAGDITKFQSALEGAQITVSDQLTPTLRQFVQFGTDGISRITDAFKEGGLSGAMDELGNILSDGIAMITEMLPKAVEAGAGLIVALVNGIADNIDTIATAAVNIVNTLISTITESGILTKLVSAGLSLIKSLSSGISKNIKQITTAVVDVVLEIVKTLTEPDTLVGLVDAGLQIILGLVDGLLAAIPTIIEAIPIIIQNLCDAIVEMLPLIIQAGIQLFTSLITALPEIILTIVEVIPQIIISIQTAILQCLPLIIQAGIDLLVSLIDGLPKIIVMICQELPTLITGICKGITDNIDKIVEAGFDLFVALLDAQPRILAALILAIPEIVQSLADAFFGEKSQMVNVGENLLKGLWEGISNAGDWLRDKISGFFGDMVDDIKEFFGIHSPSTLFAELGDYMAQGLGIGFEDEMESVSNDMLDAIPSEFDTDVKTSVDYDYAGYLEKVPASATIAGQIATSVNAASMGGVNADQYAAKQPLIVVLQMPSGVEVGRQYIDDINMAKRADGIAYI